MTFNLSNEIKNFNSHLSLSSNNENSEESQSLKRQRDQEEVVVEVDRKTKKLKNEEVDGVMEVSGPLFSFNTNKIPSPPLPKIEGIKNPRIENLVVSKFNTAKMQVEEPKQEPMPFQVNDTLKHIFFHLSPKDLLLYRVNKRYKTIAESVLIEKLNNEDITLKDIGLKSIDAVIDFFGDKHSEITCLNLKDLHTSDEDLEKIPQSFPKLEKLFLAEVPITNASTSSFKKLSELTHLTLDNCSEIDNLSFLTSCLNLTNLNLSSSKITDLSFLSNCLKLTHLDISYCDYEDISFLSNCLQLTHLNLSACENLRDLSVLSNCQKLTHFIFTGYEDEFQDFDFTPLGECSNLKYVDLSSCYEITDVSFLARCPLLEYLNLQGCKEITNLSFLTSCTKLKHINLNSCEQITDLSFLECCLDLTHIDLSWCSQIINIESLAKYTQLAYLDLTNLHKITDISPLATCKELTYLGLYGLHKITDMSLLATCKELTHFDLGGCHINDLSFLINFKKLVYLNLEGCPKLNEFKNIFKLDLKSFNREEGDLYASTYYISDSNRFKFFSMIQAYSSSDTLYDLGYCKQHGIGTPIDLEGAIQLYTLSAAKGHPEARNNLNSLMLQRRS